MKKILVASALVLLAAVIVYCVIRIPQWKIEDDIREAVFRYEMASNGSCLQNTTGEYYLAVVHGWAKVSPPSGPPFIDRALGALGLARDESDRWEGPSASAGLLQRFRSHKPPVKPASECRIANVMVGVTDASGKKKGLILVAGTIEWLSPTRVEVEGGYYEGGVSASGSIYTLVRRHGKWLVIRNKYTWMS